MKWRSSRRSQAKNRRTNRTRQFAKYHQTTGPIVGAVAVGVGAFAASYFGGPAAGAAVTAAGGAVAYAGGSYWGATAARGEGQSGREAREAGRQVGRRAAIYSGIGGAVGTLSGWGTAYAVDGGFYAGSTNVAYAGGAAEGEAGELAALGGGAGTTTETAVASSASASYGVTGEQAMKGAETLWKGYQALDGMKGGKDSPLGEFGGYGPDSGPTGGGGGGGGGDPDIDPLTGATKAAKQVDSAKIGLIILGLLLVLK